MKDYTKTYQEHIEQKSPNERFRNMFDFLDVVLDAAAAQFNLHKE